MKNWVVFPIEGLWSKLRSVLDTTVCVPCPLTPLYCCSNAGSRLGEGVARRVAQRVLSGWVLDTTVCSPRRLTSVYCRSHYLHKKKYACFQPFVFIYFISQKTYKTLEIHEPNEYYSPTVLRYQYLTETLLVEKIVLPNIQKEEIIPNQHCLLSL